MWLAQENDYGQVFTQAAGKDVMVNALAEAAKTILHVCRKMKRQNAMSVGTSATFYVSKQSGDTVRLEYIIRDHSMEI